MLLVRRHDASASLVLLIVAAGFSLGTPTSAHAVLDSFDHAWLVIGAFGIAGALASLVILGGRRTAPHAAPRGATVALDGRVALGEEA